jgi:uncharacterized integral membrane protein
VIGWEGWEVGTVARFAGCRAGLLSCAVFAPGDERAFIVQQQSGDEGTSGVAERGGARLGGGAIASVSGVAALVIFMIQNTDDVTVEFLTWHFTWPVWLLTLAAALIGAFVWFGLGVLRRHRRRKERREDRRS